MNKQRRQRIKEIAEQLDALHDELYDLAQEEDEAREAMPESFWGTERYEISEEASNALETAADLINDALEELSAIE